MTPLLNIGAGIVYLGTGGLLIKNLYDNTDETPRQRRAVLVLSTVAVILHAAVLLSTVHIDGALNLGFTSASSLVAWVIALLFLITTLARPIEALGVFILPMAGIAVLSQLLWPAPGSVTPPAGGVFTVHLVISVLAYAFLTMAMAQALLFALQEKRVRERHPSRLFHALPPLQTMENLLFQLISIGFLMLTATLVSGAVFTNNRFGSIFVFNHHTVLSLIAWIIFGTLLAGRWRFGWRGRTAIRWTVGGFTALVLAYFGTKFVLEFVVG